MLHPLTTLFSACVAGIGFLYALPKNLKKTYSVGGLLIAFIALALGVMLWGQFSLDAIKYQFLSANPWLTEVNIDLTFGLDGIGLIFLALTVVIFPFCLLATQRIKNVQFLYINVLLIEFFLILTFSTLDLFLFCLFFESLLIPMFFIILLWGSRDRRIKALTYFVLYTLFGSIFLITALFMMYAEVETTGFAGLLSNKLQNGKQSIFWMLLFITFSIKIPMFPFHIWLPEAHVEAPTVGSVLLAGLLLKLGAYGMLRFLFVFDVATARFQPYVLTLCMISIYLASFIAVRQLDMKRIIAYSSIAHMNFALLGYFSNNLFGMTGGTLLMISHGLVSSALFLLIGVLYERYHTRSVLYYGGLVTVMPLFASFFFIFTISNFSFPGTSNFVGEVLTIFGLGATPNRLILILGALSTFFGLVYSLLLYNRIIFGNVKYLNIQKFIDITRVEFGFLMVLVLLSTAMGFYPNIVIEPISAALTSLTHNITAALHTINHNFTSIIEGVVMTTGVDTTCAFTSATTIDMGSLTDESKPLIVVHNLTVIATAGTIITYAVVRAELQKQLPGHVINNVSEADLPAALEKSLLDFFGEGLKNETLHFSEVTYCISAVDNIGKLTVDVIGSAHFWLALFAVIKLVQGPIFITLTYTFFRNLSSFPCLAEPAFWEVVHKHLAEVVVTLVKSGNFKELYTLADVLVRIQDWPVTPPIWLSPYIWAAVVLFCIAFIIGIMYWLRKGSKKK